ncbi:Bin3-domain-containing protein [Schizophyllum commune H4-8]|uniref:RNA methyltransferase n=1 Tax=Schizophyllum commune (strain H4-8 / FGSC 9210) TaxID=578458 RepID=D8QDP5_SCHCM|nr:Bin3-domain-containing protein [Schizophyllum commune H4-8]KAI5888631.1 Bin3-domain-containing protein [Schizophyllum commune H4-8]
MSTTQAPIHGNYHGYYLKRPAHDDPRLALLPVSLFKDATVLDVGCNEGWVTCEIAQKHHASRVVGVDIDDTLVRAAWRHRRIVWSLQAPEDDHASGEVSGKRKRRSPAPPEPDYFPASCEHFFGPIPIPPSEISGGRASFPHNVSFRTADWTTVSIPEDEEGYDVVLALSVSKWIHLNGGDDGLLAFFRKVHSVLHTGGSFVLEPQPWDSYHKAKRMDKRLKETGQNLKLRPDDFEALLRDIGFGPAQHYGAAGSGGAYLASATLFFSAHSTAPPGFRRPVDVYTKL